MKKRNPKICKSYRIDEDIFNELKSISEQIGVTPSQLTELAIASLIDTPIKGTPKKNKSSNTHYVPLKINVSYRIYEMLHKKVIEKNTTVSQEIRYRVLATLENDIYDSIELTVFTKAYQDLKRLGNLLKMSVSSGVVNPNLIKDLQKEVEKLTAELKTISLSESRRDII